MSKLWLTETENLIEAIEQERQSLAEEHEKLGKALGAKDQELANWRAVLQSYRIRQEFEAPQRSLFLQETNIEALSYREIVTLVRDQNEGNIPMIQVTELLKTKVANPSHAASAAYSTVKRLVTQEKVTKVRPGLYRWVNGASNGRNGSSGEDDAQFTPDKIGVPINLGNVARPK